MGWKSLTQSWVVLSLCARPSAWKISSGPITGPHPERFNLFSEKQSALTRRDLTDPLEPLRKHSLAPCIGHARSQLAVVGGQGLVELGNNGIARLTIAGMWPVRSPSSPPPQQPCQVPGMKPCSPTCVYRNRALLAMRLPSPGPPRLRMVSEQLQPLSDIVLIFPSRTAQYAHFQVWPLLRSAQTCPQ